MKNLRLDTSQLKIILTRGPEQVVDPTTQAPKLDGKGNALYRCQVVTIGPEGGDILVIKVPRIPEGLTVGESVKIIGLTASSWAMGERSGITYLADRIDPEVATHATKP